MKRNIHVIYGGKSVEHEVSFKTATFIINSLDREKYRIFPVYITKEGKWLQLKEILKEVEDIKEYHEKESVDLRSSVAHTMADFLLMLKGDESNVVFPALHGTNGEDGTLQGLLELIEIPYVGNGVLASAIGIDKVVMKDLFSKANITQVKYRSYTKYEWDHNQEKAKVEIEEELGYPCYVKPAKLGSSIGINRCGNPTELLAAVKEAFLYDHKLVIEEEVVGREMQIAVIGNDNPKASVVGEFIQERNFMDFNAKYIDGKLVAVIPARLSGDISEKMRRTAEDVARLLNCSGLVRVDYFVTEDNRYFVNEVNTMPGFTKLSMFPALWEKTDGTTPTQLMDKFIEFAIEAHHQKQVLLDGRLEA
ncbi:D-alanine--D-alanine ligase [Alkaliphilus transvaalensis]|uniref:D-alanine--D-alanine ligase n=1 Tax=Alkaliphilus transvaalensis TaxID=114628 RepID=UPI00047E6C8B|nr:D-alanine--D-alanine ligase [Alkaliphilus transvaalensis]